MLIRISKRFLTDSNKQNVRKNKKKIIVLYATLIEKKRDYNDVERYLSKLRKAYSRGGGGGGSGISSYSS
jgi:hypothetical protein